MTKKSKIILSILTLVVVLAGAGGVVAEKRGWFGLHAQQGIDPNKTIWACKNADNYDQVPAQTAATAQTNVNNYLWPPLTKPTGDNIDLATVSDYVNYPLSFITDGSFDNAVTAANNGGDAALVKWAQTTVTNITKKTETRYQSPLNTIGGKLVNFFTVSVSPINGEWGLGQATASSDYRFHTSNINFGTGGTWTEQRSEGGNTVADIKITLTVSPMNGIVTAISTPNRLSLGYNWPLTSPSCKSSHNNYGVHILHKTDSGMTVIVNYTANGVQIKPPVTADVIDTEFTKYDKSGGF